MWHRLEHGVITRYGPHQAYVPHPREQDLINSQWPVNSDGRSPRWLRRALVGRLSVRGPGGILAIRGNAFDVVADRESHRHPPGGTLSFAGSRIHFSVPVKGELMADEMVQRAQRFINTTYGNGATLGISKLEEDGRTSWTVMYALTRALQYEMGISGLSNNFGAGTLAAIAEK